MSFMDFLNSIDDKYENDLVVDDIEDPIVEMPKLVRKVKVKVKKGSSVKMIEQRIKDKLDDVGLNDKIISEVLEYVFNGVVKVKGINENVTMKKPKKVKPMDHTVKPNNQTPIMSRAESILSDSMFETATYSPTIDTSNNEQDGIPPMSMSSLNMDNTSDHATALLM